MKNWWRKLAILLAFVALPLQGAAAKIHELSCLSGGVDQHAAQVRGHDHESHGSSHGHDDDAGKSDTAHFCCNLLSSGMATVPTSKAQTAAPIFETAIPSLSTLFIPEQPQRPPLA